jgi:hypothetical protein
MAGDRYRIVEIRPDKGGVEYPSTVILAEDEVEFRLAVEAELHEMSGWEVTTGDNIVVCRRGDMVRVLEARKYDPFNDV